MDKPVSPSTFLAAPRSRLQRGRVSGEERQKKYNENIQTRLSQNTYSEYSTRREGSGGGKILGGGLL